MANEFPLAPLVGRKLAIMVVAPFVVIVTLLLLLSQGIHNYPLAVSNADQGFDMPMAGHINMPATIVKALDRQAFAVSEAGSLAAAQALYDSGQVKAILAFPEAMTEDMMIKLDDPSYVLPEKITLLVNERNPLARLMVMATIGKNSLVALQDSGGGPSADSLPIPLDLEAVMAGFEPAPVYVASALLGFICFVITGIFSYLTVLGLREHRVLLASGPIRHAIAFTLVFSLAGSVLYLALASAVFPILGLALTPSLYLAALVLWLLLMVPPAMAFALGMAAKEVHQTRPLIPFFILPLFFGGFLFPTEVLPVWLQWFPYLFPPFYGLNAALAVELQSASAFLPWSVIITALWALVFIGLGARVLKKHQTRSES